MEAHDTPVAVEGGVNDSEDGIAVLSPYSELPQALDRVFGTTETDNQLTISLCTKVVGLHPLGLGVDVVAEQVWANSRAMHEVDNMVALLKQQELDLGGFGQCLLPIW